MLEEAAQRARRLVAHLVGGARRRRADLQLVRLFFRSGGSLHVRPARRRRRCSFLHHRTGPSGSDFESRRLFLPAARRRSAPDVFFLVLKYLIYFLFFHINKSSLALVYFIFHSRTTTTIIISR